MTRESNREVSAHRGLSPGMRSRIISIAIASTFLAGVVGRFVARYWTFGQYSSISIAVGFALAIALAVLVVRGNVFYRWFMVAISSGLAYSSFCALFLLEIQRHTGRSISYSRSYLFSLCGCAVCLTAHQSSAGSRGKKMKSLRNHLLVEPSK